MALIQILGWIIVVIIPVIFFTAIKPEKTAHLKEIKRIICFIFIGIFALGIISNLLSLIQLRGVSRNVGQFLSLWGFRPVVTTILSPFLGKLPSRFYRTAGRFIFLLLDLLFSAGMIFFFVTKVKKLMEEGGSFVSNKKEKQNSEPMLNFVKKAFRGFFEVILWINLIVFTVGGGFISYFLTYSRGGMFSKSSEGNPFPGIFIGLIIGLLFDIVFGGLVATFLNIDKNLEILTGNSSETEKPTRENSSETGKKSLNTNDNFVREEEHVERKTDLKLGNETINNSNNGKTKLIVERENNFMCSSIPFEIYIDKRKAFTIKNASKFSGFLKNGTHSIYAAIDNNTQSEILTFNTNNPEIKFKIRVLGIGKIKLEKII